LQPSLFRSVHDAPSLPLPRFVDGWPRLGPILRRSMFALVDRFLIEPALAPGINAFRSELGLPAVQGILKGWVHSPELVIGLFPDWFGVPQPDWPPNFHLTGFPLFDESGLRELPPELEHFLAEGEPPIIFTAGSAMRHAGDQFRMAAEACRRLGRRGILLTKYAEQLPSPLPPGVRHFDYIPFSQVLPRAAAFVHHGGVGTLAQALAAGVPQLITPFNHDQPDNAVRITRLGAGSMLWAKALSAGKLAAQLERILKSKEMAARCRELAQRIDRGRSVAEACNLIESFAQRRLGRPVAARTA
jgi:UDP:flavonoid glycosyltransferase YjiC (YdhE family)